MQPIDVSLPRCGLHDQGPRPLTAVVPLRFFGRLWLAFMFGVARLIRKLFFNRVQRMNLVYAMQWSVLTPFARRGKGNERKSHLLFETNFMGTWDEYIEGFARSVPLGMRALFGLTAGYPGLTGNATAFVDFVKRCDYGADFYYAAYTADTVDVLKGLLRYRIGNEAAKKQPEFSASREIPIRRWFWIRSPNQVEVIIPIRPGRAHRVRDELRREGCSPLCATFAAASRIHFARMLVLDFPSGSYLVFTATFDTGQRFRRTTRPYRRHDVPRDVDIVLAELLTAAATPRNALHAERLRLRPDSEDAMRTVLRHCDNYPAAIGEPARDVEALLAFLLAHQHPHGPLSNLTYCAYPETSVSEVRSGLNIPGDE